MADYSEIIKLLDRFYFDEVVGEMHPTLQKLAVDLRLLKGDDEEQHITTLDHLYHDSYQYLPIILDDIFSVSGDTLAQIEKAWHVLLIADVMLDQIVDRQMPLLPVVPLVQQYLMLKTQEIFFAVFPSDNPFWGRYHTYLRQLFAGLALESYCLDEHAQPYTLERMREVAVGKAAPLRIAAAAAAEASGDTRHLDVVMSIIDDLLLIDQLYDDARDWQGDFQVGRWTLPVVLAIQAEGKDLAAVAPHITVAELETLIEKYKILAQMTQIALSMLEDCNQRLNAKSLNNTKLQKILDQRTSTIQQEKRRYQAMNFLSGIMQALSEA